MKKNKISKTWIIKQHRDPFFKQAKNQGYRSRSAFKLIEMNNKFKFLKNNLSLLDLGSSPGGWSQVVSKQIKNGKILSVDIKHMEKIKNVDFINGNFNEHEVYEKIQRYFKKKKADIVLSDMAENTSGIKSLDSYRTGELCIKAIDLAKEVLSHKGVFISKIFMGEVFQEINKMAKMHFKDVILYKPTSSRKESKEIYIYCKEILKI